MKWSSARIGEPTMGSISGLGGVLWIHVQILEQASLWESRFVMYSRAAVPMSASSNLEVKRAIDPKIKRKQINFGRTWKFPYLSYSLVFLGTEDGCEIFSHRSSVEIIRLRSIVRCSWLEIVKKCFLQSKKLWIERANGTSRSEETKFLRSHPVHSNKSKAPPYSSLEFSRSSHEFRLSKCSLRIRLKY